MDINFNQVRNYEAETNFSTLLETYDINNLYKVAKFDISTMINDSGSELKGIFNYAESLYTQETIEGYIETYVHILKQFSLLAKDKSLSEQLIVSDIHYFAPTKYQEVIELWNETSRDFLKTKLMHELFEVEVEKTPDRIAVVYGQNQISYLSLNSRANQLARYLESKGVGIEEQVIVVMKRGAELLTILLAILKCGGVYIPLDPKAPANRNINICQQSRAKIIITDSSYAWLDSCCEDSLLNIGKMWSEIEKQNDSNLGRKINKLNLSYIIFTSGSTGLPKGVMITHQGMVNHLFYKINDLGIDSTDIMAQTATQIFDISIWQLLTSIITGGKVVVYSDEIILEPKKMLEKLYRDGTTILELVPSYANALATFMQHEFELNFKQLKHLLITGEKLRRDICEKIFSVDETVSIINAYGPTECSDDVTHYQCRAQDFANSHFAVIPLGKVGHNLEAYIVNEQLEPVPVGAIGELCISGIGLGRGYYNKPSQTAMQFIANPFFKEGKHDKESIRLYRTGDLCRATSGGTFEFIGRIDDQIKLRGYRIELGEIEKILSSYVDISQCVVEIKEGIKDIEGREDKYLVGYYVSQEKISDKLLESYLKSKLPEYMVPTYLVHLSELPLSINGKIDRKALPSPELRRESGNYIAPRNEVEKAIAEVWSDVLGVVKEKISITDDFFRLGGDSIASIRVITLINKKCKTELKVVDLFICRNIEQLMLKISQNKREYQAILKLNMASNKPNLFMIHPAMGGCEIYFSLAHALSSHFSCYGIDSYNLYHEQKICSLQELSNYYLTQILKVMQVTNQKEFHILGWSLGGELALEIAALLERRSIKSIKLYLIDCFPDDDYLASIYTAEYIEKSKEEYIKNAIIKGIDKIYIDKIITNMQVEIKLCNQKISSKLYATKILLFKAMLEEVQNKKINPKGFHEYILSLKYNNIDKLVNNRNNIHIVKLENAHHGNILEHESILVEELCKFSELIMIPESA